MSSISSLGTLAGIDLNQLLQKMESNSGARLDVLKQQYASYSARISGYGKVRATLEDFRTASKALSAVEADIGGSGNKAKVVDAVQSFVKGFNGVQAALRSQSSFDKTTKTGSALLGDDALRNVKAALDSVINNADPSTLKSIGITQSSDGTLSVDTKALERAMEEHPDVVKKVLLGDDGKSGLAAATGSFVDNALADSGAIAKSEHEVQETLNGISSRYDTETRRASALMETYRAQYAQLDMFLNQSNSANAAFSAQMRLLRR